MKEEISHFYDHNMKDLMYRDWSGFELFFIEILKCTSLPALGPDLAPLRDLPHDAVPGGAEALDPPERARPRKAC